MAILFFLYFPETCSTQTTAADDWLEQWPLAIPKAVGQLYPMTIRQHSEEGAVSSGLKNAEKLGKRRYSEFSASQGIHAILYLCHFCLLKI